MNILFQTRPDFLQNLAGDSVQLLKTRESLIKKGINVDIAVDNETALANYDLVHLFNTTRVNETYAFFTRAKAKKKPVAVSTIYWDLHEFYINTNQNDAIKQWEATNQLRREIFCQADILLPNAQTEMEQILKENGHIAPYHIVPNGADLNFMQADPGMFVQRRKLKDFILCVGRICLRKNQLALINSLRDTNLPIVLAGPINETGYFKKCARYKNVTILPTLTSDEIASAYHAAKVHVLPSWFETPGLASLEAAISGCNIVTTNRGSTQEYFGNKAFYCAPNQEESILLAVSAAYLKKPDNTLQEHVARNFTWENAARETIKAYQKILSN